MAQTQNKRISVDGIDLFYREAGNSSLPTLLLLHGFPSSSHQYRNLIPLLQDKFHLLAPDFPGFGFTNVPAERKYKYTFDNLTQTLEAFVNALKLNKYSIYIFDYGAPTGLRLALKYPDRIDAIISQNGNAYVEGLGAFWDNLKPLWENNQPEIRKEVAGKLLVKEATVWQYEQGKPEGFVIAPEAYTLDQWGLDRPGQEDIQIDLFYDYRNNLPLYPKFQEYLKKYEPKVIALWGKGDLIFIPPGAEAFKRDSPKAHVELLDAAHFALESHATYIANKIKSLL